MVETGQAGTDAVRHLRRLLEALKAAGLPGANRHHDTCLIETHISFVLLAGEYAYKFMKPLHLPFLDFSTLARRRRSCLAEVRLNAALAPGVYLDVVRVTGSRCEPGLDGAGRAIEYAVRMRRFPAGAELPSALAAGRVTPEHLRLLAAEVARFHARTPAAPRRSGRGSWSALRAAFAANLSAVEADAGSRRAQTLAALRRSGRERLDALAEVVEQRRRHERIRACHGDMHMGNIVLLDSRLMVFDCIEFNDEFRYIDVASEIAFLTMDLRLHGRADLANDFIDAYLEHSGDYQALTMLKWYEAYRAGVRVRVAAIRLAQLETSAEARSARRDIDSHLGFATRALQPPRAPMLVLTHGLPGCGKSWIGEQLVRVSGAVRVRSDRERWRLAESGSRYSASAVHSAYGAVLKQAKLALLAGWPVIADATFTAGAERSRFLAAAARLGVRAAILDIHTAPEIQRRRVTRRASAGKDPSQADVEVLEAARQRAEPLPAGERALAVTVDGADPPPATALWARLRRRARVPPERR